MKKLKIMNDLSRGIHKVGFQIKKHSPEILVVTGVVGTVASAVMACKATTKVNDILEEAKATVDAIHAIAEDPNKEEYTQEDISKALTITYVKTGFEFVKLYGPSVALGVASLTCILAGHNILHKRNVALAAAYATVDNGFKEYRGRVIERFGKELDRELRYNLKTEEIEENVVNEDGTTSTVKSTIVTADNPNEYSIYARFFDDGCRGWTKDPEYNFLYLKRLQSTFNDKLQEEGYVFLNEVYEALGIPKTKDGQVVGWVYDEKNPIGDNFIDFGFMDVYKPKARDFVNGRERTILLDFNIDGNVWKLMQ
jgi:hypothetical protein